MDEERKQKERVSYGYKFSTLTEILFSTRDIALISYMNIILIGDILRKFMVRIAVEFIISSNSSIFYSHSISTKLLQRIRHQIKSLSNIIP